MIDMRNKTLPIVLLLAGCYFFPHSLVRAGAGQVPPNAPQSTGKKEERSGLERMREKYNYKGMPADIFTAIPKELLPWFEKMETAKNDLEVEKILGEMLKAHSKLLDNNFIEVRIQVVNKKLEPVAGAKVQLNELRNPNADDFDDHYIGKEFKKMLTTDEDGKCSHDKIRGFNFYRLIMAIGNGGYFHHDFNAIVKTKGYKPQTVTFITVNKRILAMAYKTMLVLELAKERNKSRKPIKMHEEYRIPKEWTSDAIELTIVLENEDEGASVVVEPKPPSKDTK